VSVPGRRADTDAKWARDVEARLRGLDTRISRVSESTRELAERSDKLPSPWQIGAVSRADILASVNDPDNLEEGPHSLIAEILSGKWLDLGGVIGNLASTWTALWEAFTGTSAGGSDKSLGDLFDAASQVSTHATEAIARLEEIGEATNTTVAYIGDIQDMVTVARALLVTLAPADGRRTHDINEAIPSSANLTYTMPSIRPPVYTGQTRGDIYYTPIVVDRNGWVDRLRWIVGADVTPFSLDYYEVALCVYNPDNGDIEKVWGSGNIKDTAANTTTLTEAEIAMGINQACRPGQILFFAHQQVAPGLLQNTRALAAVPAGRVARPSSLLLDAACYIAEGHLTGIPSSIALSSLTKSNRFIPWGAVSVVTEEPTP